MLTLDVTLNTRANTTRQCPKVFFFDKRKEGEKKATLCDQRNTDRKRHFAAADVVVVARSACAYVAYEKEKKNTHTELRMFPFEFSTLLLFLWTTWKTADVYAIGFTSTLCSCHTRIYLSFSVVRCTSSANNRIYSRSFHLARSHLRFQCITTCVSPLY